MSGFPGAFCTSARFVVLGAGCLALANCSSSSKLDSKYGVSASERVIAPGEPVPKGGGAYRVGRPYTVAGRTYFPEENPKYSAVGVASWYGDDFHGRFTSNGEIYDKNSISAAHKTLPLPSYVRVTNLGNKRSIVVRVNDRGPFANDREIDLSYKTAQLLGFQGRGLARVKVDYVGRAPLDGSDDRKLMATLRDGDKPATMLAQAEVPPQRQAPRDAEPEEEAAVQAPVKVASAQDYAPTFFDSRPLTEASTKRVQADRPGQAAAAPLPMGAKAAARVAYRAPTTEFAAASAPLAAPEPDEPQVSPVSAYAPVRNDHASGFMSGRGLY
jgi:peptidoglycan lytic transglycosylase